MDVTQNLKLIDFIIYLNNRLRLFYLQKQIRKWKIRLYWATVSTRMNYDPQTVGRETAHPRSKRDGPNQFPPVNETVLQKVSVSCLIAINTRFACRRLCVDHVLSAIGGGEGRVQQQWRWFLFSAFAISSPPVVPSG